MIGKLIKKIQRNYHVSDIWCAYNFGELVLLCILTKSGMEMNISNCIAWLVAVLFAFITNKVFVFESKKYGNEICMPGTYKVCRCKTCNGSHRDSRTAIALLYRYETEFVWGWRDLWQKIVVSVVVVLLNYVFSKLFIFRIKKEN